MSTELSDKQKIPTLEKSNLDISVTDGTVKIGNSTVEAADVLATNGVIHVIDAVLVPPSVDVTAFLAACPKDIPTTASQNGAFTTLVAALEAANLVPTLSGDDSGPFTVFAPTDAAFAALPAGLVSCLLLPEKKEALTRCLFCFGRGPNACYVGLKPSTNPISDLTRGG